MASYNSPASYSLRFRALENEPIMGGMVRQATALRALAKKIRSIRESKGLSINAAARLYGCDRRWWSALESGRENPSYWTLCRVAHVLKVKTSELATS